MTLMIKSGVDTTEALEYVQDVIMSKKINGKFNHKEYLTIQAKVKYNEDLFDFEWDENGMCLKATDQRGNPKKPDESDNLVKAI